MHDSEEKDHYRYRWRSFSSSSLSLSFPVGIVDEGGRCSVSAGAKLLFVGFEPERLHFTLPRGMDKEAYNRGRERGERERERDGES